MNQRKEKSVSRESGFSLVLAVLILLGFALFMLGLQYAKENINQKSEQSAGAPAGLSKIEIALRSFAAARKRLPCPADPTNPAGTEASTGSTTTCSAAGGVVPWGSIGLNVSDALDAWGRKISYRVYDGATGFTQDNGLNATDCNTSTYLVTGAGVSASGGCNIYHETRRVDFLSTKGIKVNDGGTVISGVAYVLISHGSSGYGSYGNDFSGARAPLPGALSKEYPNTQVPTDNTYWKMGASTTGIEPGEATHFDDVLYFKPLSDLLNDTKLEGRDWGTVLVTKSFSSPSVTTGGSVTLTITLSNTSPNVVYLAVPLTDNLPANLTVADVPAVSITCLGGTITAVATTGTTVSLSPGTKIPARAGTTIGTCSVSVSVTPNQPTMMGASAISYSNTIAQYSLEASPNSSPTASPDPASIRNLADSGTAVVTATPPPPIVTSSAGTGGTISPATSQAVNLNSTASFTVSPSTGYTSSVGGTCGGALTGNSYVTNPITSNCTVIASFTLIPAIPASTVLNRSTIGIATGAVITTNDTGFSSITFPTFTLSAFADSPNLRNISATSGGGIGATVPNSGSGNSLTTANNEGLHLVFNADYRYAGITLFNFSTASGTPEKVRLTFYDSGNNVLTSITKIYCSTGSSTTNFTFDPGTTFRRVDIQARATTSGSSSSFLLGAINACAIGTEAACTAPSALPANNCP